MKGYYKADKISCVYYYGDIFCEIDEEVMSPRDFQSSLKNLGDDESIITFIDESTQEILDEIEAEYGLHK
jgi:hypothetical protein